MDAQLTPRLKEVAILAVAGLDIAEIADNLQLTKGTVRQYLHLVYRWYGVRNQVQLSVRWNQGKIQGLTPVN